MSGEDKKNTTGCTIKQIANSIYDKATNIASTVAEKANLQQRSSTQKALLGYWNVRGIVGYIRLMLEYCNEPYEEKVYNDFPESLEKAKDMRAKHEGCEWYQEKLHTGMKFPNLPYLYIDGYKISQSRAIMRYLARKHHLEGKTELDKLDVDQLDEALKDFLMWHVQLVYFTPKPFYHTARQSYVEQTLPENLAQISKFLGNDRQFVAGNYLTYCDFLLYEYLDIQRLYAPECVAKYENLLMYLERMEEVPRVKEFLQSERYVRTPVYAPFAAWNGRNRRESFLSGSIPPNNSGPGAAVAVDVKPFVNNNVAVATTTESSVIQRKTIKEEDFSK